jgi:uncharacterized protein (DUF983 family)
VATEHSHEHGTAPGVATLLWRGVGRRCPRCGGRRALDSWFRLAERCPDCGYRFVREDGFWLGAYVINFVVVEAIIGAVLFGYIFVAANNPDSSAVPIIVAGVVAAIAAPILFFPFSRTIWAAIDLAIRPLEPAEEAEAVTYIESLSPPASEQR